MPRSSEITHTCDFNEAEKMARSEAKRIVQLDRQAVRYVKYSTLFFQDYCLVSIVFDETGQGPISFRTLLPEERQVDEHITEAHIAEVARSGFLMLAIRLYCLLHNASLATAKAAVEAMTK